MTVCYLEVDSEITGAIARIRAVSDGEVVLVVPPGSRIATSRINFKLLVKEAADRKLNAVAVSDEPAVRALAISAGLPTYDTLTAAQEALGSFREADRRLAERISGPQPPPLPSLTGSVEGDSVPTATAVMAHPTPATLSGDTAVMRTDTPARRRAASRRKRPGVAPLLSLGLLAAVIGVVAYGAYVLLPTATITITPHTRPVSVAAFSVAADPNVAVIDVAAGVVPAERVEVPVHVEDDFAATGVQLRETRATGTVRFRSENTLDQVSVAEGTVVATERGVEFVTTGPAVVPRADFATSTPGAVDVDVRAVQPGPRGNVDADAISRLPQSLSAQLISVSNPEATTGGRRVEESVVTPDDYDAAVAALTAQLGDALATALASPESVPRGLTAFPDTARLGAPTATLPASAVVDTQVPVFRLGVDATATLLAVNEALIDDLVAERIRDSLASEEQLLDEEVASGRSEGRVVGATVVYDVAPTAAVYSLPESPAIVGVVRGKTVSEARQALARFGAVQIEVWPDFIDRIPDQAARISVSVAPPVSGS